ncbi:MAG TPA: NAD+ synthase [Arenimonas sp.]|uniref:NAD+ synthase n=1 Tax=Arenimonas sp. TaxID=1872635 RepID=UPI002D7F5336|nr:NAD+ synthase [Arenimonas sp.]HEU0153906.1 NAD+ synthase [Arenimonas sp.]
MTRKLRIALAQFDFPVGAVVSNTQRIKAMVAEARDVHGADLVLFPELALSGYPPEDLLMRPAFLSACEQAMHEIAAECRGITAVVGWPQSAGSVVYNAASVLRDGRIDLTYRKRELPNYAVFDERRHFAVDPDGGACCFELKGVKVGLVVCEDLWFAEPMAETAALGAELVLVPNASPFESDKTAQRDALLAQRVIEAGAGLAYLNLVGGQDELVFDGASVLADGDGHVHPAARAFEDHWLVADFDADDRRFSAVQWPEEDDETRESLAYRAIVRGIRDYCGKNGFDRVWLGLSGGIDSGLVLALAVDALGARNVAAVRLPSRYTSDLSNDLAEEQARLLGVRLETVAIEAPFTGFLQALSPLFDGLEPGIAEENLQSRCRGALMMALSNKFGGLLLTTGNKSEYAVGYATIYGDMCGGFGPIKDLYKTEVQALCHWRNARSPAIPEEVIRRPPSAELRENQTDQDSLPPYEMLDAILFRHVDQDMSLAEIVAEGFDPDTVRRVLQLVRVNEWKRRQSAPGPKLSKRAFGRERRYPITSGWRD